MASDPGRLHDFSGIFERERKEILNRRRRFAEKNKLPAHDAHGSGMLPDSDFFGVALSGGGIRSASFCLGALQALDAFKLIPKIDYLSTVSGGGFIGGSLAAAMTKKPLEFPFSHKDSNDLNDTEEVSHIRDNSKYLLPNGIDDTLRSFGIMLRGIVVNILLVLALIFPLATITVLANPTLLHLEYSFTADIYLYLGGTRSSHFYSLLHERFLLTKFFLLVAFVLLAIWGMLASIQDRNPSLAVEGKRPVYARPSATMAKWAIILFAIAFIAEFQTVIIEWLIDLYQSPHTSFKNALSTLLAIFAGLSTGLAVFRRQLTSVIALAVDSKTAGTFVKAILARLGIFIAALLMPVCIYLSYLVISSVGIAINASCHQRACAFDDPYLPSVLAHAYLSLGALILIFLLGAIYYLVHFKQMTLHKAVWEKAKGEGRRFLVKLLVIAAYIGLLGLTAVSVRKGLSSQTYDVLLSYISISGCLAIIAMCFSANANALHRLYRDRINTTFRLGKNEARQIPLPLSKIDCTSSPYILINATLNAKRYESNRAGEPDDDERFDPAKRGRKAEFFLFSKHFIGSEATGYASSTEYENGNRLVDLATAVAISGAAVSSNSGRVGMDIMSPTLALLNLRLGYWLDNPHYAQGGRAKSEQTWAEIFRLYLLQEAFGLLRTSSRKVLLSDGAHIDNIGLYQLLKRKCRIIIVMDAEADPAMNFGALADVQRFARIDLGHRISIDWEPMRDQARKRNADRLAEVPRDSPSHNEHFAIGRITYSNPEGPPEEGILLYIKANMTGDEPDYVRDYERRYPTFPHETTLDQLFTEEQMEAYRALGFHSVGRALSGEHLDGSEEKEEQILELKRRLDISGVTI